MKSLFTSLATKNKRNKIEKTFKSLVIKRFNRAFPGADTYAIVLVDDDTMKVVVGAGVEISREEGLSVLVPLFKKEMFKDYEKHVTLACDYLKREEEAV